MDGQAVEMLTGDALSATDDDAVCGSMHIYSVPVRAVHFVCCRICWNVKIFLHWLDYVGTDGDQLELVKMESRFSYPRNYGSTTTTCGDCDGSGCYPVLMVVMSSTASTKQRE